MTTLQHVELGVLGPLQVRQHGLPVAVPGAKPRAVLTMLGLHGGSVVSADALAELLWGARPPRTAVKALQTHISSLRRALGDGFVLTEGTGWTLSTTDIDATRYKLAARLGRDAIAAGDASQAVARFDEALSLWRGIPELPDGPRAVSEKTRWIEGHAALIEDRADALLATGRAAEIVGELEAAIADAPLRERRWGQLMLALYRAGRQGEALGAYQRARSLLADELGVDPGPNLRRLEAAIVSQDAALEIPVSQQLSTVTKAVTFLLTDIEGSTAAWETEADAMAVALARHDEIVEQVVTSRGGRLVKTRGEGDATFSVFDRPSAAAAAAIALQEAIRHEPWVLANPMRIRVALHTGEVELRDGDYFGRAVNRAARLRSLADGGQILCSGATAELVIDSLSDDVILADLGMRKLKNLARPEHVFELRLEAADDSPAQPTESPIQRPGLPAVLTGPGPFVGRGTELAGLLAAWQSTLAAGARAVLVAGEPGVGKTRLAGEWSRQAYEQGAVVLYGRCDEDLGAAYQPFAEALRSLVPCLGANRLRGLRGVEALLALVPGLTEVVPDLPTPSRSDPDTERYALFDAVVALLAAASTSAPVVLILDDLHWAAKPTLLLLRHLLRFGEHARVQIVGTYRNTDLDRSHPLAAMLADLHRDGTANRIALAGLDEDDVTAYVAEAGYDDEELARALASVTGGNPFFLIEALRHVDESDGRWDPSTLPQGVREAVSRRLSRLPAETNKALAAAAVVGSRFPLALVESVVGDDLIDAFDEASKAGIVIEEPGGRYRFNHAIVRQSLLAELASVRRMRLHQKIAVTLETEPGADDELLAELAYHYFECAWAGNAAKAVEYCRRAADQAIERLAYEGAAELYDRALHALEELDEDLPDRDAQQAELLVARCEALLAAGDVVSAAGAVSQLQRAAGDSVRLAAWGTCFDGQLSMLTNPERLDEIESAVGAAAEQLAGLEDAAGEANAHTVRAACLARLGRIGDAETALDQALTAARRAHEHRRVNAVLAGAPLAALWGPNPVPRAGGRCLDVVRLLRITTGSPVVEATSTRCQGVLDALRGRAAAGRALIDSARRSLTELGMRHALLEVEQFAGIVELVANDPAAAETHLRRAYSGFRRMGLDADTAETAALLARACLAQDRDAEADQLCTESERLAGHALKASIAWRAARAQLLARSGAHDEARRVAEEAVAVAERTDLLVDHGDACLTLAIVSGAAGDSAGARAAAAQAVELYERKGAAALAEIARSVLGARLPVAPAAEEGPSSEPDNLCVRVLRRVEDAVNREAWSEVEQAHAPIGSIESRRKIVGFETIDLPSTKMASGAESFMRDMRVGQSRRPILAVRGERLALTRTEVGTADDTPGAPRDEMLQLVGLDDAGRIALQIWFDVEDMDAAMAELDAQHARIEEQPVRTQLENACVRVGDRVLAAIERAAWDEVEQLFATEIVAESHRKIVGFAPFDLPSDKWRRRHRRVLETGDVRASQAAIAVRGERLALSRVVTGTADVSPGAPQDEFLQLYGIDNEGRIALLLFFDPEDMDAAVAELDAQHARIESQPPTTRLENAASLVEERVDALFEDGHWGEIGELLVNSFRTDDRRRGLSRESNDRTTELKNLRTMSAIGVTQISTVPIAVRGDYLCLSRMSFHGLDAFDAEALVITEVGTDGLLVARVAFDPDDIDAAFEELDTRYLAGEAAPHAHAWSVVVGVFAALARHETPPATPDWVNIDHRRGTPLAHSDLKAIVTTLNELTPNLTNHVESVHVLRDCGALFTQVSRGTSPEGFDAEWRILNLLTVDGDKVSRCELFDEADLDTALATFDALSRPVWQLENAATREYQRFNTYYTTGDWDALATTMAADFYTEDRRRFVGAGGQPGRDAAIDHARVTADLGVKNATSTVIAIRGQRLALMRARFWGSGDLPDAFHTEVLHMVEIDARQQITTFLAFDLDDLGAAIAELDARYASGEAAPHARAWSVVTGNVAAFNRHELPATTPDVVNVDHRRVTAFGPGDLAAYVHATWEQTPDLRIYIEAVHRLSDVCAVFTYVATGTAQQDFAAEWRAISASTFDGDLINRNERFDDADLDAALARFDELSRPAPKLGNAASKAHERLLTHLAAHDWDAMTQTMTDDIVVDDRRHVVNAGIRHGREAAIADSRAIADLRFTTTTSTAIATRGEHLFLTRLRAFRADPEPFQIEVLHLVQVVRDDQIAAIVMFDVDDIDAAFEELDKRYLDGEAAAHAHTWSIITRGFAALNRREIPATSRDWVTIDHRLSTSFETGELEAYIRSLWDVASNVTVYIETVYRVSDFGALVCSVTRGRTPEGFDAEWREINLATIDGELIARTELFDHEDIETALARFDELSRPRPTLENPASQVNNRFDACFVARDWDAMAAMVAEDMCNDDRRRVIGAGIRHGRDAEIANMQAVVDLGVRYAKSNVVATRGQHLALLRTRFSGHNQSPEAFHTEIVDIVEINADNRITRRIAFDIGDIDAAFEELDARYLAGEAAAYAGTWSLVAETFAAANRHVLPRTTPDWVNVDHRRVTTIAAGDLTASFNAAFDVVPDLRVHIEAVHLLSDLGAVVTYAARGASKEGFAAEWREVALMSIEGAKFNRNELFDESDLDAAIARFEDLNRSTPQLQNAASRMMTRFQEVLRDRDWDGMAEIFATDICFYDRRPVVGVDFVGRDATIANMRASADTGVKNVTSTAIAIRGSRLTLHHVLINGRDNRPEAFRTEALVIGEADAQSRVTAFVMFDIDDVDAAFNELDARYLAGEAAAHAHTWAVIAEGYATLNRHELPPTPPDFISLDRRRGGGAFAAGDLLRFISASWDDMPDNRIRVEVVHRLNDFGAVVSSATQGSSAAGFAAEWREIDVVTVGGDMINRTELYDEVDLDAALARFDELSRPVPRLQNAASLLDDDFMTYFAARDWSAMEEILADDFSIDDRRRVVNIGIRNGADVEIANMRAAAEIGAKAMTSVVIATRGNHLALSRIRAWGRDQRPEAFHTDALGIVEINADNRIAVRVAFDPNDFETALAELDARYLAGEAAAHSRTWSAIAGVYTKFNRNEFPPTTRDWVGVDHRLLLTVDSNDMAAFNRAVLDQMPNLSIYMEAVHRLTDLGGVVTHVAHGVSKDGFDAEWRMIFIFTVEDRLISSYELYDEADLDKALARFDELSRPAPRLENAATRAYERIRTHFLTRDWDALAEGLADDHRGDDRRRVVNSGIRYGRDAEIASLRATADVGVASLTSDVIATRGDRLALCRIRGATSSPDEFHAELLRIVEVDADGRVVARVVFDLDDVDAACEELDARYLAGEAAAHSRTWSLIARTFAAMNRHELDELPPTTPDYHIVDHRLRATIQAADLTALFRATWDLTPNIHMYVESVHLLDDHGVVITQSAFGSSQEGFDAQWRMIQLLTVDGDLGDHCEIFYEGDLEAALARFEELRPTAPRLENAASRMVDRSQVHLAACDWPALAELLADDMSTHNRRRLVGAETRQGRTVNLADLKAIASVGTNHVTSTVIATRGEHLLLDRARYAVDGQSPNYAEIEVLRVIEMDTDNRFAACTVFDTEDLDAAFEELDARYLAGEAAAHAETWCLIVETLAALNRHEVPATSPGWVNIDHRRAIAIPPGDTIPYLRAMWDITPDNRMYIESVHRLTDCGAAVTFASYGTSEDGFDAEWRWINVVTFEGGLINRGEIFDESDRDAALSKLDELSQPATRPENMASRLHARLNATFAARDWNTMAELLAEDTSTNDRRQIVGLGFRSGRDAAIGDWRAIADVGVKNITSTVIATRGEHLALSRYRFEGRDRRPEAYRTEVLGLVEIDRDQRITACVMLDPDEIDPAFEELDSRFIASEAAPHANTWTAITRAYAGMTRGDLPATASDLVNIDHRRVTPMASDDGIAYLRASWDLAPEFHLHIEAVHRLSDLGAVFTRWSKGTSKEGFDAEWRAIDVITVDGDLINRGEIYEETDLDAALARFDELSEPASRLENTATRAYGRARACLVARDWDGVAEILTGDYYLDDRQSVVNVGLRRGRETAIAEMRASADFGLEFVTSEIIATRGERLFLGRTRWSGREQGPEEFHTAVLTIAETNAEEQLLAQVLFDLDDVDAAFAELDARYLAGGAAAHAHTWSLVAAAYAAFNRRDLPPMTPDWVNIDHRRGAGFAAGDAIPYIRSAWDVAPDINIEIEAVNRLSDFGAVVTQVSKGASQQGFDAEWREIALLTFAGEAISRCEIFDEADLDTALARFDELSPLLPQPKNLASQAGERFRAAFAARDWREMAEMVAEDLCNEDRRSVVNGGARYGRDSIIEDMRSAADLGVPEFRAVEIATRGEYLVLCRAESHYDVRPGAFYVENLVAAEVDAEGRMVAQVMFDVDDIDAAFEELDARYLAGEAAAYADTWSVIAEVYAAFNRDELPSANWVNIDHRRGTPFASSDLSASIRASKELTPDLNVRVETVHRLGRSGAVITNASYGTSQAGFNAEWRMLQVLMVDGGRVYRCELFDEADIGPALARFDELSDPAPRLENAASHADRRILGYFAARDWDGITSVLADDFCSDDRRPMVNVGRRQGRDVAIANMQTSADLGILFWESEAIAVRGSRLVLSRARWAWTRDDQRPDGFHTDVLSITEINADERITGRVWFDLDDIDAALKELDARYVAGEAAAHAHTWSAIAEAYAAYNRREELHTTPDWVNIDRRRLAPFPAGEMAINVQGSWAMTPNLNAHIETVHRLNDFGVVVTDMARGTSAEGFEAEWREINLLTVEGDRINRCEIFDEDDLDAALQRFDELTSSTKHLENTASRVTKSVRSLFVARDWDGIGENLAEDFLLDDRRRTVNGGISHGRDTTIHDSRAAVDVGFTNLAEGVVAVRGERLVLTRARYSGAELRPEEFFAEVLHILEIDANQELIAAVVFDPEDTDAAFAELESRYIADEARDHARTWSVIASAYAALNRHELSSTILGRAHVDHRTVVTIESNDLAETVRVAWDLVPDLRMQIESVHQLSGFGAVVTNRSYGTSKEGFDAEWRMIQVLTVDGGQIDRFEIFDDTDLEAALARFDELNTAAPQLENAAIRGSAPFVDAMNRRDVDGCLATFEVDAQYDDRRKGLGDEGAMSEEYLRAMFETESAETWQLDIEPIATRGRYLALVRHIYRDTAEADRPITVEALTLTEATDDELLHRLVIFDADDIHGAFEELDSRYVAGEAAAHAQTWSVVTAGFAALSRREVPARTPDWEMVDHRKVTTFGPGDLSADLLAMWDLAPNAGYHIETVHRLNDFGAVVTYTASATTPDGFAAEWRAVDLMGVSGDMFSHTELFDESQVDAALARFDELTASTSQLENAATRGRAGMNDAFNGRDLDAFLALYRTDGRFEDRRKGLRNEGVVDRDFAHALLFEAPVSWRLEFEPVAIRGDRLALTRERFRDADEPHQPIVVEFLTVMEVDDDELAHHVLFFDVDDIEAAFADLNARWIASGDVAHPEFIEAAHQIFQCANRHDWDGLAARESGATFVNHRKLGTGDEIGDHWSSIRAMASLIPDMGIEVAEIPRHSAIGLVANLVVKGTTVEGTAIELPAVIVLLFDKARVTRMEAFDLNQRDQANARFDELNR